MAKNVMFFFLFKELNVASATLAALFGITTTIFGGLWGWSWLKLRRMTSAAQHARGQLSALRGHIGKNI
jgi:hypothetical protein